jgi:hypothetical protein
MGRFSTPFQHALRGGGRVPRPAHGQWTGAGLRWRLLESIAGVKDDMQSVLRWLEGKLPRIIYWGIEKHPQQDSVPYGRNRIRYYADLLRIRIVGDSCPKSEDSTASKALFSDYCHECRFILSTRNLMV